LGNVPVKVGYGSLRNMTGSCEFGVGRVARVIERLAL
jgi:hypothetical protein